MSVNIAVAHVEFYDHPAIQNAVCYPNRLKWQLRLQRTHHPVFDGKRWLTKETPEGWLAKHLVPLFPRKVQVVPADAVRCDMCDEWTTEPLHEIDGEESDYTGMMVCGECYK